MDNFSWGTNETILGNIHQIKKGMIIHYDYDYLIVNTQTKDSVYVRNLLNMTKTIVKQFKKLSQNAKIVFSSIAVGKNH